MGKVCVETGKHVKRYEFWNPETWAIPKLYWDTFSQEQRIHAICRQLSKIIAYADYLGVNVDDIASRLTAIEEGQLNDVITAAVENWFNENATELETAIESLQSDVSELQTSLSANVRTLQNAINANASTISTHENEITTLQSSMTRAESVIETLESDVESLENNFIGQLSFKSGMPYCRHTLQIDGNRFSAQGFDAFELANGDVISCVYLTRSDSVAGYLKSYLNDDEVSSININYGHGSHIVYHNGFFYITDAQNTGAIYRHSVNSSGVLGSSTLVTTYSGGAIDCDETTGKWYLIGSTAAYSLNINTGARTLICNFDTRPASTVNGQSGFVVRIFGVLYFGFLVSFPNMVYLYDETGKLVTVLEIPESMGLITLGESENLHIQDDGTFYISAIGSQSPTFIEKTFTLYKGNIFNTNADYLIPDYNDFIGVIYLYPTNDEYKFPVKSGAGQVSLDNVINVRYSQDICTILKAIPSIGSIRVYGDSEWGIQLNDFDGYMNLQSHVLSDIRMDASRVQIAEASPQLNSKEGAIEARLGSIVIIKSVFGTQGGLKVNNSTAIIAPNMDASLVSHANTWLVLKADLG